jgi:hypothetical protein
MILKLQYTLAALLRIIYWNVGCFLVSLLFFLSIYGGFYFPSLIVLSTDPANLLSSHGRFNLRFFFMMDFAFALQYDGFKFF